MKCRSSLLVPFASAGLAACALSSAWATSGSWVGTADAFWTNSANWSASPYPSGGDTAVFSNASAFASLDVAGLSGILNITFDLAGVPAYTIGAGAANSQTTILRDNGEIKLGSAAGNGQTFNSSVRLGPDSANASYSIRNDAAGQTLTFNNISGMLGGSKALNINGVGPITVLGLLDKGSSTFDVYDKLNSTLTVNGNSSMRLLQIEGTNSVINLGSGATMTVSNGGGSTILASQNCTVNGPGSILLSTTGGNNHGDNGVASNKTVTVNAKLTGATGFEFWQVAAYNYGTFALLNNNNDYSLSTVINVPGTIQFTTLANRAVACGLGKGTNLVLNAVGARFLYTGTGDTSDRVLDVQVGGIIEQGGTGNLKFTSATQSTTGNGKTLILQGSTAGTGEFNGSIVNGSGVVSLTKDGTGTWTLSASNTYSGATLVNNGTLSISGAQGSILPSGALTLASGSTLLLNNTAAANNTNRLSSATPIAMANATIAFSNDAGGANFAEDIGFVTVNAGACTISSSQAGVGQTSTLRLAGLARGGSGTINFTGTGLGVSDRNRIFIAGLADGPLGSWATVNGTDQAAYSSTQGIIAYGATAVTEISALGPSVIPDDSLAEVRITTDGTSGPITLAGAVSNRTFSLTQAHNIAATVQTYDGITHKTFLSTALQIDADKSDLTIGQSAGDGAVAPLGGILTLANNNAAATLTVNAPIVNNGPASAIVKSGAGTVRLTGLNTYSGQTAIIEGPLVFANSGATQALAGAVSGNGSLVKEGTGRLGLAGANSYTGLTTVTAGTLAAQSSSALGSSSAGTVIADGATLDLCGLTNGYAINLNAEQIFVQGAGVNGRGAIINSFNSAQYNALRLVSLTGDTTFGGDLAGARWDIRNASGAATFLMNNYSVSKVGSNYVGLTNVGVTPGATAGIDIKEGWFTIEGSTTMGGSAANTMTVRSGAAFDIYNIGTPVAWSLVMEDNTRFFCRQGNATNVNIWAGPVTLNGRAVFDANGTYSDTISGPISGGGSIVKINGSLTTYLRNPNNTYAGTTTVSNGTLYAQTAGSLPGYNDGRLTVLAGSTLSAHTYNGAAIGWTAENIRDLNASANFLGMTAWLNLDTTLAPQNIPYNLSRQMGLIKQGTNTLVLSGVNNYRGDTRLYAGDLILSGGGNNLLGMFLTTFGNLYMTNASTMYIDTTNQSVYLSDAAGNISKTWLGGKTAMSSILPPKSNTSLPNFVVGQRGTATLYLKDDASVTNRLYIGNYNTAAGAVYQSGNSVMHNWGGSSTDGRLGMTGYGYYELNSGTFTNNGWFQIGRDYTGVGILRQTGGAFKMGNIYDGNLGISRGGTGLVYTAGGTFAASATINVGEASDNNVIRGFADFTLAGSANVYVAGNMNLADRTNMFACVNLNGGTLTANQFVKGLRTGSTALVNFNGGTFVSRAGGSLFGTGASAVDAVNVYGGGAVFDTTNQACVIPVGLLAPANSGVASIAITPRGGYIGAPFVTIYGGGGTGATAIAQFDSTSGFVNGVTVTCPGFGYTSSPSVSFSGGGTNVYPTVTGVTLGANASGGLTKLGSGTLTLSGTNTYAGATIISNGVLQIGVRAALPNNPAGIQIAGGILDMGGLTLTNSAVTVTGGAIVNGSLSVNSMVKTGSSALTLGAQIASAQPLVLSGGVTKLQGIQPGLYEAPVAGAFNTTDSMTTSIVTRLTTRMANIVYTEPYNTTWIYKGYIWNRASTNATWTFAENFDDNVKLTIDSTVVIATGANWNTPTLGTINLSPGAHAFEARFGQGTGGGGPVNGNSTTPKSWWTTTSIGFGVDFLGRNDTNILNYVAVTDPGDGSLLSLTAVSTSATNLIDAAGAVQLASGAVLDLGTFVQTFANVTGSGIISNGTLFATGAIMPGGDGTLGTLTVANSSGISGKLRIDVGPGGTCDTLAVAGNLDLSTLSLEVANPAQLDTAQFYTVATATGSVTGSFSSVAVPNSRWHVVVRNDGQVQLIYAGGSLIKIR